MGKTSTRQELLLGMLSECGTMSIAQVAEALDISLPTARRLCAKLAQDNLILRSHGSIKHLPQIQSTYSFDVVKNEYLEEKKRIAKYASTLIKSRNIVFLEAGTTVQQFAIELAERISKNEIFDVVVFTNSLANLSILKPTCAVNMVGGTFREARSDFSGYISERTIKGLRFDLCFIGADALNLDDGIMALDSETVRFDELLVSRSEQSVILAHSAKFQMHSLISYAPMSRVSMIITDNNLPKHIKDDCISAGVNITCV